MATNTPIPPNPIGESFIWRDWLQKLSDRVFGTAATLNVPIQPQYGGTGLTTYSTGNLIYSNATDNLTRLAPPSDTSILQMTAAGVPSWITTSWTDYTPTWSTSGTAPVLGNGNLSGRYMAIGKTVFVRIHFVLGSTSTTGTGNWRFNLPVAAASADGVVMPATYLDNGVNWYTGLVNCEYDGNVNYVVPLLGSSPSGAVTNTAPFTWNSGDAITINGSYEAA
jgi:hypothetical protein